MGGEAATRGAADEEMTEISHRADRAEGSVGAAAGHLLRVATVGRRQTVVAGGEAEMHMAAGEIHMCRAVVRLCVVGVGRMIGGGSGHGRLQGRCRGRGPLTRARRGRGRGASAWTVAGLGLDLGVRHRADALRHLREMSANVQGVPGHQDAVAAVAAGLRRRTASPQQGSGVGTRRLAADHGPCPGHRQ